MTDSIGAQHRLKLLNEITDPVVVGYVAKALGITPERLKAWIVFSEEIPKKMSQDFRENKP